MEKELSYNENISYLLFVTIDHPPHLQGALIERSCAPVLPVAQTEVPNRAGSQLWLNARGCDLYDMDVWQYDRRHLCLILPH